MQSLRQEVEDSRIDSYENDCKHSKRRRVETRAAKRAPCSSQDFLARESKVREKEFPPSSTQATVKNYGCSLSRTTRMQRLLKVEKQQTQNERV